MRRAIELVPREGARVTMFANRTLAGDRGTDDPDFLGTILSVATYMLPWVPAEFDRSWSIVDVDAGRQIWVVDGVGDEVNRRTPVRAVRESDTIDVLPETATVTLGGVPVTLDGDEVTLTTTGR